MENAFLETTPEHIIHPFNPKPEEFYIEDIARSLAKQCRFCGSIPVWYSVADHSVFVYKKIKNSFIYPSIRHTISMRALLHDAAEMVISDVPHPVKIAFPGLKELEDKLLQVIYTKFGCHILDTFLRQFIDENIETVDRRACVTEGRDLKGSDITNWDGGKYLPYPEVLVPPAAGWQRSEMLFLEAYEEIKNGK